MRFLYQLAKIIDNPGLPEVQATGDQVKVVLQVVFAVIGFIALINVILAGLKLVTSLGEPNKVAQARQWIIYSVIGLVIAASAELIVTFVIGRL